MGILDGHCFPSVSCDSGEGSDLAKVLSQPSKDPGAVRFSRLRLLTCVVSGGDCGADRVELETAGRDTAGQEPQPQAVTGH